MTVNLSEQACPRPPVTCKRSGMQLACQSFFGRSSSFCQFSMAWSVRQYCSFKACPDLNWSWQTTRTGVINTRFGETRTDGEWVKVDRMYRCKFFMYRRILWPLAFSRTNYNEAARSKLTFPRTFVSWHAGPMMHVCYMIWKSFSLHFRNRRLKRQRAMQYIAHGAGDGENFIYVWDICVQLHERFAISFVMVQHGRLWQGRVTPTNQEINRLVWWVIVNQWQVQDLFWSAVTWRTQKEHITIIETFKEGECILALLPTHTAAYMQQPILCEEQSWGSGSLRNDSIVCEGTPTRFKSREITKDSNNSTIN
jgi:hypothetical protein